MAFVVPALARRRSAEDRQRPPQLDRQTPHGEGHNEARDHRGQAVDPESIQADVGAGTEHRGGDVDLMTKEDQRYVPQRIANDSSDRPGDRTHRDRDQRGRADIERL